MAQPLHPPLRFYRGDTLLGTIMLDPAHYDFPWFAGIFTPTPDFETVRPLFDRERALLDSSSTDDPDLDAWDSAWDAVCQPGLRLLAADDSEFTSDPLIHIEGTKTWWR